MYDSDTKLVRFGARDYDSETGRWTSKDPINFRGKSANLYDYVFGDPVNYRDATGRYAQAVAGVAAVAAIVAGIAYIYNHILNQNKGTDDTGDGTSEGTGDEGASTGGTRTADDVIDDITKGSTLTDTTKNTRNYERDGGRAQRDADFDRLPGEINPEKPNVKILPDGRTANKHDSSTPPYKGAPTLDIQRSSKSNPKNRDKFRYPSCP